MSGVAIALITTACVFGGTLLGLEFRRLVPGHHLEEGGREAIKVGAGMISLMAALVLGLLVGSAKNRFDSATAAVSESGAKLILLDRGMAPKPGNCGTFCAGASPPVWRRSGRRKARRRRH